MNASELVIIASSCRVIALRKNDGQQVWEAVLNSSFFKLGETFVTVAFDSSGVYAHTINETFCLDLQTGRILWQKKLASLGRGVASIAVNGSSTADASSFAQIAMRARQSSSD